MKHTPAPPAAAAPRLIAWELTRQCPLHCRHCRAAAAERPDADQLTTAECLKLLDNIAGMAKPIMILTGGEPLLRSDIYEIADYSRCLGLRTVLATCGTLITDSVIKNLKLAGISTLSISLDGANAETHDAFRGVKGAFHAALEAARIAQCHHLDFQINTTISQHNLKQLPDIMQLALDLKAITFNPFLLVPTGRGEALSDQQLSARQYEETLRQLAQWQQEKRLPIRVTCAPQYQRILRQSDAAIEPHHPGGCLGGKSFAFISHTGIVQICGFLDIPAGDLRKNDWDFSQIWRDSPLFVQIRNVSNYHGKCGVCEFAACCGGCRARAYALKGDLLAEEPFCPYVPGSD